MTPYANHFWEIFAKDMNCARYLGSKLLLNNRALRTFSRIDPTAQGNEWTVRQVKENDTRNCCHGRPQGGWGKSYGGCPPLENLKNVFTKCVDFLLVFF